MTFLVDPAPMRAAFRGRGARLTRQFYLRNLWTLEVATEGTVAQPDRRIEKTGKGLGGLSLGIVGRGGHGIDRGSGYGRPGFREDRCVRIGRDCGRRHLEYI